MGPLCACHDATQPPPRPGGWPRGATPARQEHTRPSEWPVHTMSRAGSKHMQVTPPDDTQAALEAATEGGPVNSPQGSASASSP